MTYILNLQEYHGVLKPKNVTESYSFLADLSLFYQVVVYQQPQRFTLFMGWIKYTCYHLTNKLVPALENFEVTLIFVLPLTVCLIKLF